MIRPFGPALFVAMFSFAVFAQPGPSQPDAGSPASPHAGHGHAAPAKPAKDGHDCEMCKKHMGEHQGADCEMCKKHMGEHQGADCEMCKKHMGEHQGADCDSCKKPGGEHKAGDCESCEKHADADKDEDCDSCEKPKAWYEKITPFGHGKLGVFYVVPPRDENELVGAAGGFRLAQLRLGAEWNPVERLKIVASIEAAATLRADDGISGKRIVELRDAYAEYRICSGFKVKGGQFKAPFWAETLIDDTQLPFVTRSIVAEGVAPPEAYGPRAGLSLDRQVGLQAASDWLGKEGSTFQARYALAVVNGNGMNALFNDNNMVTPVARAELKFFQRASLGLNAHYNLATEGTRPNRLNSNALGYGADLQVNAWGFTLLGGFISKRSFYPGNIVAPDTSYGVMASIYGSPKCECEGSRPLLGGFEFGVRYALLEPSLAQVDDQLQDISVMVGHKFKRVPFRLIAQYTLRLEAAPASISNDSVDLLAQLQW